MRRSHLIFILCIAAVLAITIGYLKFVECWVPKLDRGTFGDQFGGLTALFSGLAFAGLIYTLYLQGQQLKDQAKAQRNAEERFQKELSTVVAQNAELARTAEAQEMTVRAMIATAEINRLTAAIEHQKQISLETDRHTPDRVQTIEKIGQYVEEMKTIIDKLQND
jgi:hypothetical protein